MQHIYDMLIIGGGPAGYTAALYASRAGLDTILIERMSAGGQMTLTGDIDNYPGFEQGIDGFTLGMKMQQCAERFGAKTEYAEVLAVDFSETAKKIETTNGDFFAKTVVIATGANPRKLGLDHEQELTGKGLHYCAHCDGRFYKDKTVLVVGGGNSAASDALYLSRLAKKVYVVHRRDTLRAAKIYHEPLMQAENIEFLWNSVVSSLVSDNNVSAANVKYPAPRDGVFDSRGIRQISAQARLLGSLLAKIENVQTGIITEVACDGVFVSIGRKPATEFLNGTIDLDENGYILADESTKTNIPGIYAAGDVRSKPLRQIVTAVSDGAVAAHFAEEYLGGRQNA